jgi:hypothetical protein
MLRDLRKKGNMSFFVGNHQKENDKLTCRTAAVIFLSLANGLILLKTGLLWVSFYDHDASPFLQRIFNIYSLLGPLVKLSAEPAIWVPFSEGDMSPFLLYKIL